MPDTWNFHRIAIVQLKSNCFFTVKLYRASEWSSDYFLEPDYLQFNIGGRNSYQTYVTNGSKN